MRQRPLSVPGCRRATLVQASGAVTPLTPQGCARPRLGYRAAKPPGRAAGEGRSLTVATETSDPLPHPGDAAGTRVGRLWDAAAGGPLLVTLREGRVVDVTAREAPTMRDLLERDDPVGYLAATRGRDLGALDVAGGDGDRRVARPLRPAGAQGLRRHLRPLDDRARHRGARRRRPGPRRGGPRTHRRR